MQDLTVLTELDRFHLAGDAIDRAPRLKRVEAHVKQLLRGRPIEHRECIRRHGDDMPEVRDWKWSKQV